MHKKKGETKILSPATVAMSNWYSTVAGFRWFYVLFPRGRSSKESLEYYMGVNVINYIIVCAIQNTGSQLQEVRFETGPRAKMFI